MDGQAVIHTTDVAVIGGGAVGCSIAYWLAGRGRRVAVIEEVEPGAGASGANFGLIWSHTKEPHTYLDLHLRSLALWPRMVEALDEDVDLRLGGGIQLCLDEAELEARRALIERQLRFPGYTGRMLTTEEVRAAQPGASPSIAGASIGPDDGDCDGGKWVRALARACRRSGVAFLGPARAVGLEFAGDGAAAVRTSRGVITAAAVVNAAGASAAAVAAMAGVRLEIAAQYGQILITEPAPITCPRPMALVRQDAYGRYHLSTFHDDEGPDVPIASLVRRVVERAARYVPAVRGLRVMQQRVGRYPKPADDLPYLGAVTRVPGFYVAVGHSGIGLSPIHGQVISDLIVDGGTDVPIAAFDPSRHDP